MTGISKNSDRRSKRLTRANLSYANVMATVAFFVAVAGGSAYAVSQIDGSQIRNHSISARKLVNGIVVPHAKLADNVSHLLVSSSKRSRRRRGADVADAGSPGSLVTLSVGQSVTVFQNTPFTITASCTDEGNNVYRAAIDASASVDGWYAPGAGPQAAGATVTVVQMTSSGPQNGVSPGLWFMAPGGASLTLYAGMSVHEIGNCSFELYGIG
jgi:hypothetical protein